TGQEPPTDWRVEPPRRVACPQPPNPSPIRRTDPGPKGAGVFFFCAAVEGTKYRSLHPPLPERAKNCVPWQKTALLLPVSFARGSSIMAKRRGALIGLLVGACGVAGVVLGQAQSYPGRAVTLIVPLAAGTGMDTLARLYGEPLGAVLGKPVVIENRLGAGLMLGTAAIAAAAPDGHTIGISTAAPMSVAQ